MEKEKNKERKNTNELDVPAVVAGYIRQLIDNCEITPQNQSGEYARRFMHAFMEKKENEYGQDILADEALNQMAKNYSKMSKEQLEELEDYGEI